MTMTLMCLHEISMLKLKTVNDFTKQTHRETSVVLITPLPFPFQKNAEHRDKLCDEKKLRHSVIGSIFVRLMVCGTDWVIRLGYENNLSPTKCLIPV